MTINLFAGDLNVGKAGEGRIFVRLIYYQSSEQEECENVRKMYRTRFYCRPRHLSRLEANSRFNFGMIEIVRKRDKIVLAGGISSHTLLVQISFFAPAVSFTGLSEYLSVADLCMIFLTFRMSPVQKAFN